MGVPMDNYYYYYYYYYYFIFHHQSTNGPTGPTGKVPSRHRDVFLHHLILEAIWMSGAGIGKGVHLYVVS